MVTNDEEFSEDTAPVIEQVKNKELIFIISDLLEAELTGAPSPVRELLSQLPLTQLERVQLDATATALADTYINEKVVGKTSRADCQHIALATIHRADVLISWNFKHIANLERIRGYNSVNLRLSTINLVLSGEDWQEAAGRQFMGCLSLTAFLVKPSVLC